jgi:hypothetical protein
VQHLIQNTTPVHPSYSCVVFALMTVLACAMLAAYLLSLPLCLALPQSPAWPKGKTWNADELNDEFKGIYWNHIVNEENDCLLIHLNKIVWATRATMWLLDGPISNDEYPNSEAWTRYFGDANYWLDQGPEVSKIASDIQC